jgi:transposase
MAKQVYWLSDADWRRIEPLLPRGRRGAHRVEDRRVISGIVHMLRCGARWRDCPEVYGPYTTIYNRFNRWSRQGIWTDMDDDVARRTPGARSQAMPRPGGAGTLPHAKPPGSQSTIGSGNFSNLLILR